jgi:hypothetical protein
VEEGGVRGDGQRSPYKKPKFDDISKHLMEVDLSVLNHFSQEMEKGEKVVLETDEESYALYGLSGL